MNARSLAPRRIGIILAVVVAIALPTAAWAAQDRYDDARQLAFSGDRDGARAILAELLAERPNHWDARILMGRLYAWDKRYEEGREQLLHVVRNKPGYADARNALTDLELWADNPERALHLAEEGLSGSPNNEDFLYRKAQAQRKLGDLGGAALTLDRLLDRDPSHQLAANMLASIRVDRARTKFGLGYGYTDIDTVSNPWHGASASLSRRTGFGSVILRANWSRRFGKEATQFELDAYPRIVDGLYMYVNYGYSQDSLYPRHRYAAELYANLPHGIELSAGFRRLHFASSEVMIYTGTVAKYQGSWWISFRPYVTPKSIGTSRSYALTVRRYFGSRDTYLAFTGGMGSSPGEIVSDFDLTRLDSRKVGTSLSLGLGDFVVFKLGARYSWEELLHDRNRHELSFSAGIERRF